MSQAAQEKPLRRADPRTEASQVEIHGIATRVERQQCPFIIWDLSDRGLRLWIPEHVSTNEVIRLTIAKPFVLMLTVEVRWCKASHDGNGFHVGVRALNNLGRLEVLHRELSDKIKG